MDPEISSELKIAAHTISLSSETNAVSNFRSAITGIMTRDEIILGNIMQFGINHWICLIYPFASCYGITAYLQTLVLQTIPICTKNSRILCSNLRDKWLVYILQRTLRKI